MGHVSERGQSRKRVDETAAYVNETLEKGKETAEQSERRLNKAILSRSKTCGTIISK